MPVHTNKNENNKFFNFPEEILYKIFDFLGMSRLSFISRKTNEMTRYRYIRTKLNTNVDDLKKILEYSSYMHYLLIDCNNDCDLKRLSNSVVGINFSNLESLILEKDKFFLITKYFLHLIEKGQLINLVKLALNISNPKFHLQELRGLKNISKLKKLEILNLKIRRKTINSDIFMKCLMEGAGGSEIKILSFDFVASRFQPNTLKHLETLCALKNLSTLSIDLTGAKISQQELNNIEELKGCKELRNLSILLWGTEQGNDVVKALVNIGAKMDPINAKKMRSLNFDIGGNFITKEEFQRFEGLSVFEHLISFTFGAQGTQIEKGFSFVKNLKYLKNLTYYFGYCRLDLGIDFLTELQETNIRNLNLDLRGNNLNNEHADKLAKLCASMTLLQHSSIYLTGNSIEEQGASSLLYKFNKHKSLLAYDQKVKNSNPDLKSVTVIIDLRQNPLEKQKRKNLLKAACSYIDLRI